MAERTYQDLRALAAAHLDAHPDNTMTLTELVQHYDKALRRKGADSPANHFMVEFAAYIDRNTKGEPNA